MILCPAVRRCAFTLIISHPGLLTIYEKLKEEDMMSDTTEQEFTAEETTLLQADAAEADRGYDLEFLRTRPIIVTHGRPLELGHAAGQRVQFRLAPEQLARLDKLAEQSNETRSDVIRRAIDQVLASA